MSSIVDENVINGSPVSTPKRRKLNAKGLFDKVMAMSPIASTSAQNATVEAETPRSTKKRLVSELNGQYFQLAEAERDVATARAAKETLLRQLAEIKAQHQIHISKIQAKATKLSKKNSKVEQENEALTAELTAKQTQVDAQVDTKWKQFIYDQQSQNWYREYETRMQ